MGFLSAYLLYLGQSEGDRGGARGLGTARVQGATNAYGSVTSAIATITISSGDPIAPTITGPTPSTQTVVQGNNITFTTSVSGFPAPTIQWQKDGVDVAGSNATSFTITSAQYPADQATYSIIASNSAGLATNSVALTVYVTPVITTQPTNLTVVAGSSATFTVNATGVTNSVSVNITQPHEFFRLRRLP